MRQVSTPEGRRASQSKRRRAAAVLGGSWLLLASGLVAWILRGGREVDASFVVYEEFFWPDVLVVLIYGPVSALVLAKSRHPVGWVLALVSLGFAASAASIQWSALGVVDSIAWHGLWVRCAAVGWLAGALAAVLVLPWILAWPAMTAVARGGAVIGGVLTALATVTRLLVQAPGAPDNPLALTPDVAVWAARIDDAVVPLYFAYAVIGTSYVALRYRGAPRSQRAGLAWVVVSLLLVSFSYISFEVGLSVGGLWLSISTPALLAAQLMLAAAMLVLVVRDPRWGLDVAVSRATVWGLLTTLVVAVYLAGMWAAGLLLPLDQDQSGVLIAAVVALAVSPVRSWVQRMVDRLIYGVATSPDMLLTQLGYELGSNRREQSSLDTLTAVLRTSMRLAYVGVASSDGHEPASSFSGRRGAHVQTLPLRYQGRHVGHMEVSAHHGERLDPRTIRVLEQLSGLVAIAVELAQVNRELADARTRIVHVRNEERRLLRRELHDGLGPALAGASLALAAVGNNNPSLRPEDKALLSTLRDELASRAGDLRGIARAILPPALDEGRLDEALRVLATVFTDDRFKVHVHAHNADTLDVGRQVAIYHICAEAVMNAFKHGKASVCTVTVNVSSASGVTLTVHDNGRGMRPTDSPGIGLRSMRERAMELGGSLQATGDTTGTTIHVELP